MSSFLNSTLLLHSRQTRNIDIKVQRREVKEQTKRGMHLLWQQLIKFVKRNRRINKVTLINGCMAAPIAQYSKTNNSNVTRNLKKIMER